MKKPKKASVRFSNILLVIGHVILDAEPDGELKEGKGYSGEIDCPICKIGRVIYAISSINHHTSGKCSTENCVSWIQ